MEPSSLKPRQPLSGPAFVYLKTNALNALAYPVSNADSDKANTESFVTVHFRWQLVHLTCWNAVSYENCNILNVRTISVCFVEYLLPHQSQSASRIRVTAYVWNLSDSGNQ